MNVKTILSGRRGETRSVREVGSDRVGKVIRKVYGFRTCGRHGLIKHSEDSARGSE